MSLDAETREQLIDTVRRFVAERLRPLEAKVAEDDAMPADLIEEMKGLGLFGLSIPAEYGGLDLSMEEECLIAVELGRTSPAFRSTFGTNVGIGSQGLVMFGTDEQKQKYLPGLSVGKPEKKMGQQGAHICDVIFENVRVPAENRLGREGEGFKVAMQVLDRGRLHISAVCVGVAERLIADCVAYMGERKQFGQPIAGFQLIQGMIADSKTESMAARALLLESADRKSVV